MPFLTSLRVFFVAFLVSFAVNASAQVVPYSTTSKATWSHDNGTSATTAQGFTFRLYVDGSTTPLTLSGTTCVAPTAVDGTGAIWAMGNGSYPNIPVLRNGTAVPLTFGAKLVANLGAIYLQGDDLDWYKWNGTTFNLTAATDPSDDTLAAAVSGRWQCAAPFSPRLALTLNVLGAHNMRLRVYDATFMTESPDSTNLMITSTALTAPLAMRVTP